MPLLLAALLLISSVGAVRGQGGRIENPGVFAPAEGIVRPQERPYRQELCLNGRWQFQPIPVPAGYKRGQGAPPRLPLPSASAWETTPIKIPSPWNVNAWGTGHPTGDLGRPYDPGSTYFPSYPAAWNGAEMGWLHRTFRVPAGWQSRRIVLHFEAVAGECRVLVNGKLAGAHFDSWLPFDLDITSLVKSQGENELLVGVRAHALFDKQSARYSKMHAPYPIGSSTERLVGIWQDVFLLGLPAARVQDVFVKPFVDKDTLEAEVTVVNDSPRATHYRVGVNVCPWINLAHSSPAPKWMLGAPAFTMPATDIAVQPGKSAAVTLRRKVGARLRLWSPDTPNLYAALVTLQTGGRTVDTRYERFGWRQFAIHGRDLQLNGRKIQLTGDLLHPFGPFILSRGYAWAWYRAVKEMGGNSVRLHAQVHPRHYLELADEMGIAVLDETSLFGSSVALNFEEPIAWQRFADHYDGLVLRDRNHPSVFGWSFGNELFAIFDLNQVSKVDSDRWYGQLADLGLRARKLDNTRDWISCDGDEDLRGRLPVWGKHFGYGLPLDRLPNLDKPEMVGESGGTYYARPEQLAVFNGDRAYESYRGRSEALGIDVYANILQMAKPRLAYYSASETAWFGLEPLPLGYHDTHRLPGEGDGVFFTRTFEEGRPGIQIERIPPYVTTLNPGWDSALPLYKPLPMYLAEQAALQGKPRPWAQSKPAPKISAPPPMFGAARFIGDLRSELGSRLRALGVPLQTGPVTGGFAIVDPNTVLPSELPNQFVTQMSAKGAVTLWMVGDAKTGLHPLSLLSLWVRALQRLGRANPIALHLIEREATQLLADRADPWTSSFSQRELYMAEDGPNRFIQRVAIGGLLPRGGKTLLRAADVDWSLFNNSPEEAKCGAEALYESLEKPAGASLVTMPFGEGTVAICSLDYRVQSRTADAFWRKLLTNMGLQLHEAEKTFPPAFEGDALLNSLSIGRFGAADVASALAKDFVGESAVVPANGDVSGNLTWAVANSPSRDRFVFQDMPQSGPDSAFAEYFSFWVRSPRALDDLLAGGPDAPRFGLLCYVSEKCRLFLNGNEVVAARTQPVDYRVLAAYESLPLKKGWNQVLIKVASGALRGARPATLAVRMFSSNDAYLHEVDTAVAADRATLSALRGAP